MEAAKKIISVGMCIVLSMLIFPFMATPALAVGSDDVAAASIEAEQSQGGDSALAIQASKGKKDIVLGMFTQSTANWTNNIFASYDGRKMYRISSVYASKQNKPYMSGHYAQQCPSIMYHKGYFWSLSNENKNDGKFWPVISYSKDLVHWTHPENGQLLSGTHGISLDKLPTVNGSPLRGFDVVAPEWSKSKNGSIYIVFTAGYYGEYHGEPMHDQMQAYTVKVSNLSASDGTPDKGKYLWPSNLKFKAQKAKKLSFSNFEGADFIDGQIFADKGRDYLIIKKDGLTNQLYKTSNINNPNGWRLVNSSMTFGYEGASVTKLNKKYLLYADGVLGTKPLGVRMVTSTSLTKKTSWGEPTNVKYIVKGGKTTTARHGTAITLKAGTKEWKVAKKLLDAKM